MDAEGLRGLQSPAFPELSWQQLNQEDAQATFAQLSQALSWPHLSIVPQMQDTNGSLVFPQLS